MHTEGPRVYNLFPLLAGPMPDWSPHIERAARMGFQWIFVNSFHQPGISGSLYCVRDHFAYHPFLVQALPVQAGAPAQEPEDQFRAVLDRVHGQGLSFMMDLVINHTAIDAPLVQEHPEWYRWNEQGGLVHPGAYEGSEWVSWEDLAAIDNDKSSDRDNLWRYWLRRLRSAFFWERKEKRLPARG